MPERDAFGNLLDEDPIAAMGWAAPKGAITRPQALQRQPDADLGDVQARLAKAPVISAAVRRGQAQGTSAGLAAAANESFGEVVRAGRSTVRARRSRSTGVQAFGRAPKRLGGVLRLVVGLLVLAWLLPVGAIVDGLRDASRDTPADRGAPRPDGPRPEVARGALLTTGGFTEALAGVRELAGAGSRPVLVRVDADGLDVEVVTRSGALRGLTWRDGEAEVTSDQGRGDPARAFAWDAVDPRAPSRLARQVQGLTAAVLTSGGELGWTVFTADRPWVAGPDGRDAEPV